MEGVVFCHCKCMGFFGPRQTTQPGPHGKTLSDVERRAAIRRVESDLSILYSDRLKLTRRKTDRDLALRKLKDQRRRLDIEIENIEKEVKKDEVESRTVEEDIRLAKKRLVTL
jgi:hypothetical protein